MQREEHGRKAAVGRTKRTRARRPARDHYDGEYARVLEGRFGEILAALSTALSGDFSVRMSTEDPYGATSEVARAFNDLIARNEKLSRELARVAAAVGKEGQLSERAVLESAPGEWARSVASVNALIHDVVRPTGEIARVVQAISRGDLSQKMSMELDGRPLRGEFLRLALGVNETVHQLVRVSGEVTRLAREVGTDGKLGGQAEHQGLAGTWRDLTDQVNMLAGNLTSQIRNIALVTTAVANGDLSQKITVDARGEFLSLKDTVNTMVDQLRAFAAEVTRVAREVGTEGMLGGQAEVEGVSGTWKDLTNNVNVLAGNLTSQVRNIALVTTAVAKGDLSQKITVDARGEIMELKNTINAMVDQLRTFAAEVTRVAREVGTEGKLGGQARVPGVAGTWQDLTDNVNMLASNLTSQVRSIATVTTAIANGDLSKKTTVDARGEILELKNTINGTVDQLRLFASEVTRVAREVGTEGLLGGQAAVPGVAGTWKDLTENVNLMASNLTSQVRGIVKVVNAVANGDLSTKLRVDAKGEIAALADTINMMTDTLRIFAEQVTTVAREVGIEGKLGGQAKVPGAAGTWRDVTDNVNMLAGNLTSQVRNIALVTTAVANGDLSRKITVDARGEILQLKETINEMVERLRTFAAEVTRVAREVGTEGNLGGQAHVPGVAGTWKDLTDNVNLMASNLTDQVRGIVKVVTAVAKGNLSKKLFVEAKGEIAALADTINDMTDTLRVFAEQVTSVAREVGIEGKLGGQAKVPGAAGTWRDLTDNVNQLAGNLTTQVRAISEVATSVTKGNLTRTIDVEAQGEVLGLKDTINQMIANLRDTTTTNKEQDWLKTNLARFSGLMQGQRSVHSLAQLIMSELTPLVSAQLGAFYVVEQDGVQPHLRLISTYAYQTRRGLPSRFPVGEGIVGQAALEKKRILVMDLPPDYVHINSGLGEAPPQSLVALPVLFEGDIKAVIELASFQQFSPTQLTFLEQVMMSIGVVFNMIAASTRTEDLLAQLKLSNKELGTRTSELEDKASLLEVKNREIAQASASLEEKAKQLALVSKYKSEFLANMSHELRTPLNSLLILAKILADNEETNLTTRQVDYARTIHASGKDLLELINQILDLSRIEAGRMQVERRPLPLGELRDYVDRNFRQIANEKGVEFSIDIDADVPAAITTDPHRLQQILKNLLSNAFKFTEHGGVRLRVAHARHSRAPGLARAKNALVFEVSDTGIGIPPEKQQLVFEAFQQADASTSRTYGGSGLGLTISRELARLLGGEIQLLSTPGEGSTFSLLLPLATGNGHALAPAAETAAPVAEVIPHPVTPGGYDESHHRRTVPSTTPALAPPGAVAARTRVPGTSEALRGKNLLIVDDDIRNLFAVASFLEREGVNIVPANSADEAFAALESHHEIDAVLMDIMMPGTDGYEATRRIRANPRFASLPVIALTAKAMPGDREKCIEAGCDDFVAKPVDTDKLIEVLEHRIRRPE